MHICIGSPPKWDLGSAVATKEILGGKPCDQPHQASQLFKNINENVLFTASWAFPGGAFTDTIVQDGGEMPTMKF